MAVKLSSTTRIFITLGVILLVASAVIGYRRWAARQVFDSVRWRQAVAGMKEWRKDMYHDLLRQHNMAGWTQEQVISLLGEPDGRDSNRGIYYWLGQDDGFPGIDELHLCIKLDDGRVAEVVVLAF
jgi:hypothetical protein